MRYIKTALITSGDHAIHENHTHHITLAASSLPAQTVSYELKLNELKYDYGVAPPVAHLKPGDVLETNTIDADGHALEDAGMKVPGPNPLTGPFYIEGAEPGDTVAIHFLAVDVNAEKGFGSAGPGFGAINSSGYTPMLGASIPRSTWAYVIDKKTNTAAFKANDSAYTVAIPLHPFLGCVGVAPAEGEARSSIVPAEFGGNMDAPEATAGNTLYLPVNVAGALLYLGDGHAAMGDGEVDGTAIEISMKVKLEVEVIKHKEIKWPRFENPDTSWPSESTGLWTIHCASPSPNWSSGCTTTMDFPKWTRTNFSPRWWRFISIRWLIRITPWSPRSIRSTFHRSSRCQSKLGR